MQIINSNPNPQTGERMHLRLERLRDPLLTVLTVMLAVLMFVVAPLQASGVLGAHWFGIGFGLVLVSAAFIVSRSATAIAIILLAFALIVAATVLRLWHPSVLDIYLDTSAWLITGMTLSTVVARAVFAPRTGYIPSCYRRCLTLPQYWVNLRGVVRFRNALRAEDIQRPTGGAGQSFVCKQPNLL